MLRTVAFGIKQRKLAIRVLKGCRITDLGEENCEAVTSFLPCSPAIYHHHIIKMITEFDESRFSILALWGIMGDQSHPVRPFPSS